MSTTETRVRSTNGHADASWSDQVVLSGAGLISQGIDLTRSNASSVLGVVDDVVLGTFDVVEEWSALAHSLTSKPIEVARRAYTSGSSTLRQVIGAV